jgi:hypothetical protein
MAMAMAYGLPMLTLRRQDWLTGAARTSTPLTVAEELENRGRCLYGLRGVCVAVDDGGEHTAVVSTAWGDGGVLEVTVADGRTFPADRLALRSPWPVVCCDPKVANEWNRDRREPPPKGQRPPP